MDAVSQTLIHLQAALSARMPGRHVTDVFINHPERKNEELAAGVVTVLLTDVENTSDWSAKLRLKIIGQLRVAERDTTGADVQRVELVLWQQLTAALRNLGVDLPSIEPPKAQFSRQLEHPYGWIALDITTTEIDLTTGDDATDYPLPVDICALETLHADLDIPEFAPAAVHQQWAGEEPASVQPDLTLTVELQP